MTNTNDPFIWQTACTNELRSCVQIGGFRGQTQWLSFRDTQGSARRTTIADADFSGKGLENFDLSRCWIGRTSFKGANLTRTMFSQTIFRDCDATNANIEGANFRNADMRGDGLALNTVKFDDQTVFEVRSELLPDDLHSGLRLAAERARRDRLWRVNKSRSSIVRWLLWMTDYGYSFYKLAIGGAIVVLVFAVAFWILGAGIDKAAISSVNYFLALDNGFESPALQIVGSLEALIGMLFFAILTSTLVSLFFDKN